MNLDTRARNALQWTLKSIDTRPTEELRNELIERASVYGLDPYQYLLRRVKNVGKQTALSVCQQLNIEVPKVKDWTGRYPMKLSELIKRLEELKTEHGDLELHVTSPRKVGTGHKKVPHVWTTSLIARDNRVNLPPPSHTHGLLESPE